ncbi:helix-turn-helix domain-containing protein [Pseudomonas sp. EA_5y_Pfl2_R50]|uniref:helix-turn-helix domain-containing protein n=1 Tax=Pseudomonas sp. EA_5y_Pfl2_R50 TaxID=3088691 RepID=UPI0030DA5204
MGRGVHRAASFRQLCRRFNISPSTAYKWLNRFENLGVEGLTGSAASPGRTPPHRQIPKLRFD